MKLADKLLIPFSTTLVFITVIVGLTAWLVMNQELQHSLEEKAHSLSFNLADVLGDIMAMSEYPHAQRCIESVQRSDADVAYVIVLDTDGKAVATTDRKLEGVTLRRTEFEKDALNIKTTSQRRDPLNSSIFEIVSPIKSLGGVCGTLRVGFSESRVRAVVSTALKVVASVAVVALAVAVFVSIFIIRIQLVLPIRALASAARRIAQGDAVEKAEVRRNDELGELLDSMNDLIQYFQDMSSVADAIASGDLSVRVHARSEGDIFGKAFEKMIEGLKNILGKLAQSADGLSKAANDLADISTQHSSMTTEQATSIQQSLSMLEDIRLIVNKASENAQSVVEVSEHSMSVSLKGQEHLEGLLLAMIKIRDEVGEITRTVAGLAQKAVQISDITTSVEELADQSNILTINASMEAVRAGEVGRPFGAVAREVKLLAQQSKQATARVRNILEEIQQATESTIEVTNGGRQKVESGVKQAYSLGDQFNTLYSVILKSADKAKEIASSTNEQARGIEMIALDMRVISKLAKESALGAQQQNATAMDLSSLADTINGIVQNYQLH